MSNAKAKRPLDRLPKKSRHVPVFIVMDDERRVAYDQAATRLEVEKEALRKSLPERLRALREELVANDVAIGDIAVQFDEMRKRDEGELADLQGDVDKAREALDAATARIVFKSIGRKAWDKMVRTNPPTEDDLAAYPEGEEKPQFSDTAVAPAIIADAFHEAVMDGEKFDIGEPFDDPNWNVGELQEIYRAALSAQLSAAAPADQSYKPRR